MRLQMLARAPSSARSPLRRRAAATPRNGFGEL